MTGRQWPRRHLGRTARRAALIVHIVSAGAWIGVDVVVAVLVAIGAGADDPSTRGAAYVVLGELLLWPMLTSAMLCLASGLVLGAGTKWGLVRFWWVVVKLAMTIVLVVLITVLLRPGLSEVAAEGRMLLEGRGPSTSLAYLAFPPAVSLGSLTVAVVLAVLKPWGPVRASPDREVVPRDRVRRVT